MSAKLLIVFRRCLESLIDRLPHFMYQLGRSQHAVAGQLHRRTVRTLFAVGIGVSSDGRQLQVLDRVIVQADIRIQRKFRIFIERIALDPSGRRPVQFTSRAERPVRQNSRCQSGETQRFLNQNQHIIGIIPTRSHRFLAVAVNTGQAAGQFQPRQNFVDQVDAGIVTLIVVLFDNTVLFQITERYHIAVLRIPAVHRHVMSGLQAFAREHFVQIAGIGIMIRIASVLELPYFILRIGFTAYRFVIESRILPRIGKFRQSRRRIETDISVVTHRYLAFLTRLGGHQDDAVCSA